ncbi:hypothetical protein DEIPH_ctg045orf0024 [Deinococcus phoenicis]|uniref:histidine kinase n=1 Tax=Deinococcus phoenicis TaxID=1476583 RepID=A0A016QMJ0_9DEIO|nr:GAF domain-containing protein [Deinococcus phoenicis]EYB67293.1 hypothetical protein DEIPH_ctg045orf0024 [Deinococcus phoenicis]
MSPVLPPFPSLGDHLQDVTEALAAARTQADVFGIVLRPALEALGALAGAVLLVGGTGETLSLAATQGHPDGAPPFWQAGPLDRRFPAGDALARHEALFFEHAGAMTQAYPELSSRSGGTPPVASAVLPMFLDGAPLGVLVLDFREPHEFTVDERRFLRILTAQCAVALGRAQLLGTLSAELRQRRHTEENLRVSEARFRRLVESSPVSIAAGDLTGTLFLVNGTYLKLLGYTRAEFEAGLIDWAALTPPEYREADERAFAQAFEHGASDRYEKEMLTRTGERVPLTVLLLRYEEHGQQYVVGYLQDLRPFRAAERVLREHGAELARQVEARTAKLEERTAALDAFVAFTEAIGSETDVLALARQATQVVRANLDHVSAASYELEEGRWKARVWSEDVLPDVAAQMQVGVPQDAPNYAEAVQSRAAVFVDGWDAEANHLPSAAVYGAAAFIPIFVGGEVRRIFAVGTRDARAWTEREKAVVRAVGRSLGLALERTEAARRLKEQNAELAARTRALEGFAALTRDLSLHSDPTLLVRLAQEVVLPLLPEGYAAYYEPDGGRWRLRSQVGDRQDADFQTLVEGGLPLDSTHSLLTPWTTRQAYYLDEYDQHADGLEAYRERRGGLAALPVLVNGQPHGVFGVALRQRQPWGAAERAVLETVVHSLGLALERAEAARKLQAQNAELEARSRALESFSDLLGDLTLQSEPNKLIGRALDRVMTLLPEGYGAFWELRGERWYATAQARDVGSAALQATIDAGLPAGQTPTLDIPYRTRAPYFQDVYAQGADTAPEVVSHVNAVATLPVLVRGEVLGIFNVPLFHQRRWSAEDRAVLETTVRSLGLALERAEGVADLARRTEELARSNAELEQFAYIASHDLQAPIRAVTSFAGMIERKYGGQLDERGRLYLRQIVDSGEHMKRLVDDLLAFSRVHTQQRDLRPTDSGAVFDHVVRRLQPDIEALGAVVTRTALPSVLADPQQLDQLLQNLISNALKYRREGVPPRVQVTAERDGEWQRFAVTDNGIGIEPEYFERIFVIFQRLHGREAYEGTGIGLAVCKKIVERHGGQLWLESTPGQGSTFFFTLPAE